ncbi:MAG: type II toxin-antitoxin system VapC family toxin [Dehalococcoidia bacterium]|nr:type II toxin-antitoxin system VapC family toxin [Dehalococcoidia bacterium]
MDASVALAWGFDDEASSFAVDVLSRVVSEGATAPAIWPLEVLNGIVQAERRGRINATTARRMHQSIMDLRVQVEAVPGPPALRAIHVVARERGLTAYDAAYVELARRMSVPLATLDVRLRTAAESAGVVVLSE